MRTIHVVKTLAQQYGGPARSTQGLVAALKMFGKCACSLGSKIGVLWSA